MYYGRIWAEIGKLLSNFMHAVHVFTSRAKRQDMQAVL